MTTHDETPTVPEPLMKEVFRDLVDAQDGGESVSDSRARVAGKFALAEATVVQIERTGIANGWPPLD